MTRTYSAEYKRLQPYVVEEIRKVVNATGGGIGGGSSSAGGVTDHGRLTGLLDDDHPQYLTPARGDVRYVPLIRTVTAGDGLAGGGALSADIALALTTPGTLTVSSTNAASGSHTHAITASSDVGTTPAAALLKSTAGGALSLYNAFIGQGIQTLSPAFETGFAGRGWRADYGLTTASRASVETDDLTVRGRMRVYELLIQQIRATNGSVLVSSSSKVYAVTVANNPAWTVNAAPLTFNGSPAELSCTLYDILTASSAEDATADKRRAYHGFLVGDIIRAQRTEWNGSSFAGITQSDLEVTSVVSLYEYIAAKVSGDAAAVGYDYVRLGNTSDTSRQGVVYLTSDDSAAPFIDIADGVRYHSDWGSANVKKTRVGKLSGITDYDFGGALTGYGLYANNAYLKGRIVVTGGSLGGLAAADVNSNTTTIDGGHITTGTVTADQIAARAITGDNLSLTSYLAINSATYGDAGIQLQFNGGNPRAYMGNGSDRYFRFDGTNVEISGYITTTGGSISGNLYAGMNNLRFGTDGQRLKMQASSSLNINTAEGAFRWFEDLDVTPTAATDYVGQVAYRNTSSGNVIDSLTTSYVGTTNSASYAARVGLQAGHTVGSTYTSAYMLVVKEPATGSGSFPDGLGYMSFNGDTADFYSILALKPLGGVPTMGDGSGARMYVYNHKLVISYYTGGTYYYRYIPLNTTQAGFTYNATTQPS